MQSNVNVDYKRFHIRFALFLLASIFFSSFYAGNVLAKGSIKAGADKAKVCQVCHGKGGHSTKDTYPILAGQHAAYIQKQLKAFKAGTRKDPIMNGQAAPLSDQDIEDVAAFFQSNR
jgi:cytochrome c553